MQVAEGQVEGGGGEEQPVVAVEGEQEGQGGQPQRSLQVGQQSGGWG